MSCLANAVCASCGKQWQVREASKAYRCQDCGGSVQAEALVDQLNSCTSCNAALADQVRFCEECGTPREAAGDGSEHTRRLIATRELARAKEWVRITRILLALGATFDGIALLMLVFSESRMPILIAIVAIAFGITLTGAVRIFREPFLWSVLAAAYKTLGFVGSLVDGFPDVVSGLMALALWFGVARIAGARRFIHEYPDLWQVTARLRRNARRRARKQADTKAQDRGRR